MDIGIINSSNSDKSPDFVDLVKAIRKLGHMEVPIQIDTLGINISKSIGINQSSLRSEPKKIDVDCALLRSLGIIKDYEQWEQRVWSVRAMELSGTYVMNPVMPWLASGSKLSALLLLAKNGIRVPDTVSTENLFIGYDTSKKFKESVIKQLRSAMGFGIFKVDDPDVAWHSFSYLLNLNKPLYVQRYIEKIGNGDYRVIVIGGKVLGVEFRKGITWKSNVAQGATPVAVKKPDKELCEMAIKSTEALGLEFAGIDIAETKDGYYVLESNPSISWQGFRKVTGINPALEIIKHAAKKAHS